MHATDEGEAAYVPGRQGVQAVDPVEGAELPRSQPEQEEDPGPA